MTINPSIEQLAGVAYHGPVGDIDRHFAALGHYRPTDTNPAGRYLSGQPAPPLLMLVLILLLLLLLLLLLVVLVVLAVAQSSC